MSISTGDFFYPYVKFLHGAAYNLHQILEGLGVVSSNFTGRNDAGQITGTYWSPDEAVLMFTLGYPVMRSLLLIPLLAAAAYTVGKKRGVLIFFVLLLLRVR